MGRYGKYFQKEWVDLEIKNLGEYPDLFFQCNKSLLADIFEIVRDKCIEIYEGDPVHFVLATGLAWQVSLKKDRNKDWS